MYSSLGLYSKSYILEIHLNSTLPIKSKKHHWCSYNI